MEQYKILSFNKELGQLIVEFAVGMQPITIDVPIKNGLFITGAELEEYVQGFIPTWFIERQRQLNVGVTNASELEQLIAGQNEVELPVVLSPEQEQEAANAAMWAQQKFESDIAKVLVKFGVLETDPTEIPVTQVG
jgi:hypothetical protein